MHLAALATCRYAHCCLPLWLGVTHEPLGRIVRDQGPQTAVCLTNRLAIAANDKYYGYT